MDPKELIEDPDEFLDYYFDLEEDDEKISLTLQMSPNYYIGGFMDFLGSIGAVESEAIAFHRAVGIYEFYKNGKYTTNYSEYDWKWIKNPKQHDEDD